MRFQGRRLAALRDWLDAQSVVVAVALLLFALTVQAVSGAYSAEWTVNADEPSHFLSGVMVRDYMVGGIGQSPMAFARDYYAHYPKIGIGNWPPAYYAMQGLWLTIIPPSRAAILVMLALMVTVVGWLVFRATRPTLGAPLAMFAALTFVLLHPVPRYMGVVMAEVPLAYFVVTAVLFWMRFMETERPAYLIGFGIFAVCAIMVKGNGLALALLPPLSIVVTRRWRVLRIRALWKTAGVVALLTVPWVIYYLPTMRAGWALPDQPIGQFSYPWFYATEFYQRLGVVLSATALVGVWVRLRPTKQADPRHGRLMWASALSAILAGVIFHTIAPGGLLDIRHMIPVFPFVAMFIAAGTGAIAGGLARVIPHRGWAVASAILFFGGFVFAQVLPLRVAPLDGFRDAAQVTVGGATAPVISLISSDAPGEGAFVVETALRDPSRPTHVVWRASKLLASTTWAGRQYRMRATTTDSVLLLVDRANIDVVVFDSSWAEEPHQRLLLRLMTERPDRFTMRQSLPVVRNRLRTEGALLVFDVHRATRTAPDSMLRQIPGYNGVRDPLMPRTAP